MHCPECGKSIPIHWKLFVAARRNVECPACGVAILFGYWPRLVHTLVGDLVLLVAFAASLWLGLPSLLVLAAGSWVGFALTLPVRAKKPSG